MVLYLGEHRYLIQNIDSPDIEVVDVLLLDKFKLATFFCLAIVGKYLYYKKCGAVSLDLFNLYLLITMCENV
jgi:hypothetical protein